MSWLLLSLSGAASTLSVADTSYVVDKFRQACMQGQTSFASGQIKEIEAKSMGSDVRSYYSGATGARYYEIALSEPAYLVFWKRKPSGYYYTQGCAVITRNLPYIKAWELVLRVQFSSRERARLLQTEAEGYAVDFPLPEEGRKITIDRIYGGRFVSLQVSSTSTPETREWKKSSSIRRSPLAGSPN